MDFDILQDFIYTEIMSVNTPEHQEMYDAIRYFLTSFEIREGKFEANEYLINKLNRDTVVIYQEFETPKGWVYSQNARMCDVGKLLNEIDNVARKAGLDVPTI